MVYFNNVLISITVKTSKLLLYFIRSCCRKKKPLNKSRKEVISSISSNSGRKEIHSDSEKNNQNCQPSLLCKICYSEEKNILFIPCKHVAVCKQCSIPLSACPICRRTIVDTIRIYNSWFNQIHVFLKDQYNF